MSHYSSLDDLTLPETWLTIGIFDGLHRGHHALINALVEGAHASGSTSVVLTFHPHPAVILGSNASFRCLTTPDERAALLSRMGVDHVITQPFDLAFAAQEAGDFMQQLQFRLGVRHLVIGHDFALGRGRLGNAEKLAEIGEKLGYTLQVFPPLKDEDGILSSTRIRQAIASGQVEAAARALGRPFSFAGEVLHGDGRGRTIKIPTANLSVPGCKAVPGNGVYACRVCIGESVHPAVTNIGTRPTFTEGQPAPTVETHILDFDRDLYGQELHLEFIARLREERKFPSVQALVRQIHADIERAREILGE